MISGKNEHNLNVILKTEDVEESKPEKLMGKPIKTIAIK